MTTNYGFLDMALGLGSIFGGPVAAMIHGAGCSWIPVFIVTIVLDTTAAILALLVLTPMRKRYLSFRVG